MTCALCGYESEGPFEVCAGCSVNSACQVTTCPHCGYRSVQDSWLVGLFRRLFSARREHRCDQDATRV